MDANDVDRSPLDVAEAFYALPPADRSIRALVQKLYPNWKEPGFKMSLYESRFGRMIRAVEEKGLVHHTVIRPDAECLPRRPELEHQLRQDYGLRQVVVVDIGSLPTPPGTPATHRDEWNRYDDEIHKRLGAWCGRLLASCLRPGDRIATGGGRGALYAVDRCRVGLANRYAGNIQPLSGRMTTRSWDLRGDTSYLDADNVTSTLHGKLGSRGKIISANQTITERGSLPRTDQVTVAVIGVGALGGGHRLKDYKGLDDLKSVVPVLRDLNATAESIEQRCADTLPPFFHPVGDVCNWYFVVGHESQPLRAREHQALTRCVKQLNDRFLTTSPERLAQIAARGMVVAVAGRPHKVAAIRHVIAQHEHGPWITHLVTDHKAAECILRGEIGARAHGKPAPEA